MQERTNPHSTESIFLLSSEHFLKNIIPHSYREQYGSDIYWPAYLPDLNLCEFFLWGLKDRVYQSNPNTLEKLNSSTELHIFDISRVFLQCGIEFREEAAKNR
jgi:hypothetical protein